MKRKTKRKSGGMNKFRRDRMMKREALPLSEEESVDGGRN